MANPSQINQMPKKKNPANWGHLQLENAHIYLSDIVNVQDLD